MKALVTKESVEQHFDSIAKEYDKWRNKNLYYAQNLTTFVTKQIRPGSRVLEVGCGTGEILNATQPSYGVGVDLSAEMIRLAESKFPDHKFVHGAIEDTDLGETFDYIILVDVLDHVHDIYDVMKAVYRHCHPTTRVILTTINPWWDPILSIAENMGAKMPEGPHNFIEKRNIDKVLQSLNYSISYSGYLMLIPKYVPLLSYLANTLGVRTFLLNKLSSVQYMILQPTPENETDLGLSCSVIIPCYNEEGNIENAIRRVPKMGKETEIVVVNDGGTDRTVEIVKSLQAEFPNLVLVDYSPNRGKGKAVNEGFQAATKDVVMILDADLTVDPDELPRFFEPLNKGICEYVNGTRLIYPMEKEAMRTLNLMGNKVFGLIMSFILKQDISDTLCGTKGFYRKDLPYVDIGRDKWGDYDILFGMAKLKNKMLEIPVHYKARVAGESKMKVISYGLHLIKVVLRGFKELVFDRIN